MVEAATNFRKNGFNDEDSATLAVVASKFQNVADETISAGESADFIISQLIAFGIEAENAERIIDSINEVSNNFSVSSGDLSKALGVVASTSGAMGNSMEETLGIVTAITEQTRNASRAARGANSIFANLVQVLDDTSSNGKKITEIFKDLGVEMYENGQLKSGFDLLAGMAEKWGTLDSNTQKYIATTLAGTNQLNNFLALMNNFDHAIDATETAMNSAGSASEENARAMESLEAKTNAVKASFEALANSVIDSDLVKIILDLSKGFLDLANNGIGTFIIQAGLIGGVLWGGQGLITAMKLVPNLLAGFTFAMTGAAGATSLLGTALSLSAPQLFLIAAAITGIITIGSKLFNFFKNNSDSVENLTARINESNTKLEENKKKLDELNAVPYENRTPEIQAEIDALEEENELLREQIDLNRQKLADQNIENIRNDEQYKIKQYSGYNIKTASGEILGTISELEIAQGKLSDRMSEFGVQVDLTKGTLEDYGYSLEEVSVSYKSTEQSIDTMINRYLLLQNKIQQGIPLTAAEKQRFNELYTTLNNYKDALKHSGIAIGELEQYEQDAIYTIEELNSDYIENLNNLYALKDANDETKVAISGLENTLAQATSGMVLQQGQVDLLINTYPELKDKISEVTGGFQLETQSLIDSANQGNQWAISIVKAQKEATEKVYNYTINRIDILRDEMEALRTSSGIGTSDATQQDINKFNRYFEAITRAQGELARIKASGILDWEAPKIASTSHGAGKTQKKTDKIKEQTDALKEQTDALKEQLEILDDRAWFLEQQQPDILDEDSTEEDLRKYKELQNQRVDIFRQAQDKIHAVAEALRAAGLSEDSEYLRELGRMWMEYQGDIEDIYSDLEDASNQFYERDKENWEKAQEAKIRDLEEQASVYEKLFNLIGKQADDNIKDLEDERDRIEAEYDAQIEALEKVNDELDEQLRKEEALDDLARARQSKVMVYKDGRFQYVQDIGEVSEAQANLDKIKRDEALRQEVENLEQLKEQAVESIDEQIKKWEDYKLKWANVVSDYQEQQDKLLIAQELGIELEGENWNKRLENLQDYVDQYIAIMEELNKVQNQKYPQTGGGSSGGGAVHPVGPGASGGVTNSDGSWSPFPGGPVYNPDGSARQPGQTTSSGGGGGSSGGGSSNTNVGGTGPGGSRPSIWEDEDNLPGGAWVDDDGDVNYPEGHPGAEIDQDNNGRPDSGWLEENGAPSWVIENEKDREEGRYANGTLSAYGGLSLVGEKGPELRVLNSGDGILPAEITKNLWDWGKFNPASILKNFMGSSIHIGNLQLDLPNVKDPEGFANYIRYNFVPSIMQAQYG